MIRIAICESDEKLAFRMEHYLLDLQKVMRIRMETDLYFCGENLEKAVRDGVIFDVIYLAIRLKGKSGIDTARELRRNGCIAILLFVSAYEDQWKELLETRTFEFIKKPVEEMKFKQTFIRAYQSLMNEDECYHFTHRNSFYRIPVKEILFLESDKRCVIVHTVKAEYRYYGKLSEAEEKLKRMKHDFLRIHKSYLVNFTQVESICWNEVRLFGGTVLAISEERRRKIRSYYK
ncbi:MAG: LytTR family DNA-binding domain-containing protein [Hespellia sp.]|nr:LytTR family DNA-binding domain-containing protein [Hespellia sp.]